MYPPGLEDYYGMFRACSTAKLFLDHMLPETVDAGVYLDTDILLLDDITHLINHMTQFSPGQVMGLAATENIYNVVEKIPYYGPPGDQKLLLPKYVI